MMLRPYQQRAVDSVWKYFEKKSGNPLIAMPTGTGKSHVIGGFLQSVYQSYPNQRIMVLTHVKELIVQNHEKLIKMWPTAPAGIFSAGLNRKDLYCSITFAGIASVAKKAHTFGHIDLVIIDEAHLVSPAQNTSYLRFLADLKSHNPFLKVIGLTATPYRLGQGLLTDEGGIFTDTCYDITGVEDFNRLIYDGYILPLIPKRTDFELDVDGVHMRGGEFIQKELQFAVDKFEITERAIKEAIEHGINRACWLVFAAGIEHAIHTAEMLCSMGITAKAVHGGNKEYPMSNTDRAEAIRDHKKGDLQCLVNNNVLTTGFDNPLIDLIISLRPTSSPGLWVQMLGRGTRPVYAEGFDLSTVEGRLASIGASQKQNCLVLDFGANTFRLGPINDPVIPNPKSKKKGVAPVKLCETCDTYNHASVKFCINCNQEFFFTTKLESHVSNEDLIKADAPIVECFNVDHITYSIHSKKGAPNMMKVTYCCGFELYTEYLGFEHNTYISNKANRWWKERTDSTQVPATTKEAIENVGMLSSCTHLRVWVNKKYPEILAHCFDGTNFGQIKEVVLARPTTQVDRTVRGPRNYRKVK